MAGGEAASVTIDNGVGEVTGSSTEVFPDETTTYTLTATNESGDDTQTVTVSVSGAVVAPPEDAPFDAADLEVTGEEEGVVVDGPFVIIDMGYLLGEATYPEEGYSEPELSLPSGTTTNGTVSMDDGEITYFANEGDASADSFEYTLSVTDEETGQVLTDSATVTIDVQ